MTEFAVLIGGIVLMVIFSGIFSSAEVAYTGLSLSELRRVDRLKPGLLKIWEKSPDRVLATLLISNNAVNAGVGAIAAGLSHHVTVAFGWPLSLSTLFLGLTSGTIILLFGEILPKVWARRNTVSWALTVTPSMSVWTRLVSPLASLAAQFTNRLVFKKRMKARSALFLQRSELKRILTHANLPKGARRILHNVMEFTTARAGDVMTHRSDIFAVSLQQSMKNIINGVIQSGFSRIPVYSGSIDKIQGILYAKDLLIAWRSGRLIVLEDLLRPIKRVSIDTPVSELLRAFRSGRHHMAVVTDKEEKKVLGLVTIQDVVETIVGDIREEV